MALSTFTGIVLIPERSEATPGLWNNIFSTISSNLDQLNSDKSVLAASIGTTTSSVGFSSNTIRPETSSNTITLLPASGGARSVFVSTSIDSGGQVFNVKAFGAIGDGATDDTASIQLAVVAAAKAAGAVNGGSEVNTITAGNTVYLPPTPTGYKIAGTVIQLPFVSITGSQTVLIGNGTNLGIDSGYLSGNTAITNFGSSAGSNELHQALISGLRMYSFNTCIRWQNTIRGSAIEHCYLRPDNTGNDGIALYRCFTSALRSIHIEGFYSRASGSISSRAAINLLDNCNGVAIQNTYCHGIEIGMSIRTCYGIGIRSCNFEISNVGLDLAGFASAVIVDGSYFEKNNTGMLIGSSTLTVHGMSVDANRYSTNSIDIDIVNCNGLYIGPAERHDDSNATYIRSGLTAQRVIVDHGMLSSLSILPWNDSHFSLTNGIVLQRLWQSSQSTAARSPIVHYEWFNGLNQWGYGPDGTALAPTFSFSSENSLGWYRSAASTLAQSYGTTLLPGNTVIGTDTGGAEILRVGANIGLNSTGQLRMGGAAIVLGDGTNTFVQFPAVGGSTFLRTSAGGNIVAASLGTWSFLQNRCVSMRTLAASSVTVSAAKTNVAVDEVVFTIGGASGASLIIYSGGTAYGFNSAFSAAAA